MNQLTTYIDRSEFDHLTEWHKALLARYVRRFGNNMPIGRTLAIACMRFNKRYKGFDRINQKFINWLYYY